MLGGIESNSVFSYTYFEKSFDVLNNMLAERERHSFGVVRI